VTVKHLYRKIDTFMMYSDRPSNALSTLVSSIRGTAYKPYHKLIENLDLDFKYVNQKDADLQELMDSVLLSGNLRSLGLRFVNTLKLSMKANVARVTNLIIGDLWSATLREWLVNMLPQMQLEDLNITLKLSDLSWDVFTLQENTLKSLIAYGCFEPLGLNFREDTSFARTFVATQWHSLTTLRCDSLCFALDQAINLPNLQSLELTSCRLEGWDHLCNSFTMLKRLKLEWTEFVGLRIRDVLSTLPPRIRRTLRALVVFFDRIIDGENASWFSAYASSFTSLQEFNSDQISVETLTSLLPHCPLLEIVQRHGGHDRHETLPTDAHLKTLSERAPPSLRYVSMKQGNFSSECLAHFVQSCGASLQFLDLDCCSGLTPSILRAMFQLPLRELSLMYMTVRPEHRQELERMYYQEKPQTLRNFR
jgi:hypothetical protein